MDVGQNLAAEAAAKKDGVRGHVHDNLCDLYAFFMSCFNAFIYTFSKLEVV